MAAASANSLPHVQWRIMFRWLSVFSLLLALFGFGLALQAPMTRVGAAHDAAVTPVTTAGDHFKAVASELPTPGDGSTHQQDGRTPVQAEADTVVDVTLLFEPARHPGSLVLVAATPSRFGWTPVATPFIEGLQRPPRQALLRA
ncbi:MAG: hypothetical protein EOP38_16855 [Rubrivivax sp.]|nr:MAG: hypothetical protein EOP38_16855 [Rubrivivax sp.]